MTLSNQSWKWRLPERTLFNFIGLWLLLLAATAFVYGIYCGVVLGKLRKGEPGEIECLFV